MINLAYCVYLLLIARLERRRQAVKRCRKKNPEKALESARLSVQKHRNKHPDRCREAVHKYRRSEKGKARTKARLQERREENPTWYEKKKKNRRASLLNRYRSDPEYRLVVNYRTRLGSALKHNWKSGSTIKLLGCSAAECLKHLEKKFLPGMTWENYGPAWHVDHIRPCASFDLTDPEQQKICFHFSNLQPLWEIDNLSKGDKYVHASR